MTNETVSVTRKKTLRITNSDGIHFETLRIRWEKARYQFATQHWKWSGGDAIVVPAPTFNVDFRANVFLRVGKKVHVVEGVRGLMEAIERVGLDPKSFKVA
jgi:hypothetical protein